MLTWNKSISFLCIITWKPMGGNIFGVNCDYLHLFAWKIWIPFVPHSLLCIIWLLIVTSCSETPRYGKLPCFALRHCVRLVAEIYKFDCRIDRNLVEFFYKFNFNWHIKVLWPRKIEIVGCLSTVLKVWSYKVISPTKYKKQTYLPNTVSLALVTTEPISLEARHEYSPLSDIDTCAICGRKLKQSYFMPNSLLQYVLYLMSS